MVLSDSSHNGIHGFLVITTSLILQQALAPTQDYTECMLTSAYHDVARLGRDGPDIYEMGSAEIVMADTTLLPAVKKRIADRIVGLLLDTIFYCYKGADSLNYPSAYNPAFNPINLITVTPNIFTSDVYMSEFNAPSLRQELELVRLVCQTISQTDTFEETINELSSVYNELEETDDTFGFDLAQLFPHLTAESIQDLGLDIIQIIKFFHLNKYFRQPTRIFDDLYTILQSILPILPLHLRYLAPIFLYHSKFIICGHNNHERSLLWSSP